MKFICYTNWDQLPTTANALFLQAEKDSLFFSRPWFENLASTLDDNETMVLACVIAENKVMAILPLIKSAGKTWYSLNHRYTTHYSLLLAKDAQAQILSCLVQGLADLRLQALLLQPVADDDRNLQALQSTMEAAGFSCEYTFRFYNWIYRVQGKSYADYMAARPAKLRNTIARKARKLEREHGYELHLFLGDDVPHNMPDYYTAYNASWKANEQYADFLNSVVAAYSKKGWTRLAVLYVKKQPVAAQLWFVHQGKASIFRLSYDKAWKPYSPGSILTRFLMEYVIDTDKVEEIDFLTGNDAYKQDWMSRRRERFVLSCVKNIKPTSKLHAFGKALKRILQR